MQTPQDPINSGFNAASTAAEVMRGIDLTGKTAIVTGGYSGLGRETARVFLAAGARVIVPARDVNRAAEALKDLEGVEIEHMDLMAQASIDAFAERFLASGQPLHILVNNAGIMACPLTRDARGYEAQFATNHLGHFQLVARLLPALRQANGARVISVSSLGHRYSPFIFDDSNFERREYNPWTAYGQSKTANILFALELDKRASSEGIRAFSLHPGAIAETNLGKHVPQELMIEAGVLDSEGNVVLDVTKQLKTVEQGAATQVWCATNPQLDGMGGVYCENCEIAGFMDDKNLEFQMSEALTLTGVMPYAVDAEAATRLWDLSEKLLGWK